MTGLSNNPNFFTGEELKDEQMILRFKSCLIEELEKRMVLKSNGVSGEREYKFPHQVRGIAIVISNKEFLSAEPRNYADIELRKMNEMFEGLGYIVMLFKNLTAQQMYEVIRAATCKEMDFFLEKSDSFACVLASHGNEVQEDSPADPQVKVFHHVIHGTDMAIRTHLLLDLLDENQCNKLQGKPKLFFVQACRSRIEQDPSRFDSGALISSKRLRPNPGQSRDKTEGSSKDSASHHDKLGDDVIPCLDVGIICEKTKDICEDPSIIERGENWVKKRFKVVARTVREADEMTTVVTPCHNDFLILYSTSEGKAGFGREDMGGWLLHVMHEIMSKHITFIQEDPQNCLDFLSVMTYVMHKIEVDFETNTGNPLTSGFKIASTLQHKLSKDLIFRKKYIS